MSLQADPAHTERLLAFLDADGPVAADEVMAFFDSLDAVAPAEMIGDWDGQVILTGHPGERHLDKLRWAGKAFRGLDDVDPMVCLDDSGDRQPSEVMGGARLRSVGYRGVVTATMIYDRHPIFDHFHRVSEDTVLGVMDTKGDPELLFFCLRRRA